MKEIQPVTIWYNGIMVSATIYNMTSISDNLINSATFYWQLYTIEQIQVAEGNLTMTGDDYISYSTSNNSNEYAYQWGTTQLNLTLVNDIFKVEMPTNELINTIPITLSNI